MRKKCNDYRESYVQKNRLRQKAKAPGKRKNTHKPYKNVRDKRRKKMKTLDDMKQASDEELLNLFDKAQGDTKNFMANNHVDFSYTTLVNEITDRGYSRDWHKPEANTKDICVELTKNTGRLNLGMTPAVKTRYEKFLNGKDYNYMYTSAALTLFMDLYNSGNININVTLGKGGE